MKIKALDYHALRIVLVLAASCLVAHAAQEGDFKYYEQGAGITISGYTGSGGIVTIPDTIAGKPVTHIGDSAFFDGTSLTSVTIPNSVTAIGTGAFSGCTGLTGVTIPDSVTSIGDSAFSGCSNLTSLTVDPLNPAYSSLDGVLFNKAQTILVQYPGGKMGNYAIPHSVNSIGGYAFLACKGLTSVTIPDNVLSIGIYAFHYCTGLASATLGNGVTDIGYFAFFNCTNLTEVSLPNSLASIGDYAFSACSALTRITIPNSVTGIGRSAFEGCAALKSVRLGNGVTFMGEGAFQYCPALTRVAIAEGATAIGQFAFTGCTALNSVTIPKGVTSIGGAAFLNCSSLVSIGIPNTVTDVGGLAFSDCTELKSVYFLGDAPRAPVDEFGVNVFLLSDRATLFYRVGATGWDSSFLGRPTMLWVETDDLDDDGMNNLDEMLGGTDPLDARSLLAFENAPRPEALTEADRAPVPPGQHALYFQSIRGMRYEIFSSDVLGGAWASVATVDASELQKRVLVERPASAGFYRIKVLP